MYDILGRDVQSKAVEVLEKDVKEYKDAQRIRTVWQKQSKGKFVFIKKH